MPVSFLSDAQRERLERFPQEVAEEDLLRYFALSDEDVAEIRRQRGATNRLCFALSLCALRYLGFIPDDLGDVPLCVVDYVARQLDLESEVAGYGKRTPTLVIHRQRAREYLGFVRMSREVEGALRGWLLERALEHDTPTALLGLACEWLHREKVVRPRVTTLARLVAGTRGAAEAEIHRRLGGLFTPSRRRFLDGLLDVDEQTARTRLVWLRSVPDSNSPAEILDVLEKLALLKRAGVDDWDLSQIAPNRLKVLARIGSRAKPRDLRQMKARRRYTILLAFLHQALAEITDEVLDMFENGLGDLYARAERQFAEHWKALRETTNEKLGWFQDMGEVLLNTSVSDEQVRGSIFGLIPKKKLAQALEETKEIVRPKGDAPYDFFARNYSSLRRFIPRFLELLSFEGVSEQSSVLAALALLRELDAAKGRPALPSEAPIGFVDEKWGTYVFEKGGGLTRRYYELCALWELRNGLRDANIWVSTSRRYAALETYLIPRDRWPALRPEVCRMLKIPEDGVARLDERKRELELRLERLDRQLAEGIGEVRMESGELIVSRYRAQERPGSVVVLEEAVAERFPQVELSELLIEVDSWTDFSSRCEHAAGVSRRSGDHLTPLYASILAHACNFGLQQMANITDISYDRLDWCTTWYLREATLKSAFAAIINYHHRLPLTQVWGEGTLSSSDGQRFPATKGVRRAKALPRAFGFGSGLTLYSWTSSQFAQYGAKLIPSTARDAPYVLDEILDNVTELVILEHATDTAGYTELIFALFDLLGLRFAPRIRDLKRQRLYRLDGVDLRCYPRLRHRFSGVVRTEQILKSWDDLLRIAGSLKLGWVTASLLVQKLQRYPEENSFVKALHRYGRIPKTLHILEWYADEALRRRIGLMLNKGEALHSLRTDIRHVNKGVFRRGDDEALANEVACLNLVVNAIIVWNTVYMQAALDQLRLEGYPVKEEDLPMLWPTRHEHINVHGKLTFDVEEVRRRTELRPLREPRAALRLPPIP